MGYDGFFNNWNRIFNSPAFTAINKLQKNAESISKIVNPPGLSAIDTFHKNAQALSKIVNSPASMIIKNQQSLWDSALTFSNALKVADMATIRNQSIYKNPFSKNQIMEIKSILKPSNSILSAIINNKTIFDAFNNTGVFSTISLISNNMSAITAISKLNSLASILQPLDYIVKFSNDNDILVDDEILSEDDILEFAKEFNNLPLDNLNSQNLPQKLKSKKGAFFIHLLWFILFNLLFSPIVERFFSALRDKIGISKILEKIDVEVWVDELWKNKSGEIILNNLYLDEQDDIEKPILPDTVEE